MQILMVTRWLGISLTRLILETTLEVFGSRPKRLESLKEGSLAAKTPKKNMHSIPNTRLPSIKQKRIWSCLLKHLSLETFSVMSNQIHTDWCLFCRGGLENYQVQIIHGIKMPAPPAKVVITISKVVCFKTIRPWRGLWYPRAALVMPNIVIFNLNLWIMEVAESWRLVLGFQRSPMKFKNTFDIVYVCLSFDSQG